MLEKLIKFQHEVKSRKIQTIQPLLPSVNGQYHEYQINNLSTIDHKLIGNRYCGTYRSTSQKRNQIRSIRRSKIIAYSQMVDNYKNTYRQSQENPFKGQLSIKPIMGMQQSGNDTKKIKVVDDLKVKYNTLEAEPKSQRYQSCPRKTNFLDAEIKISPYNYQKNNCVDYYYII